MIFYCYDIQLVSTQFFLIDSHCVSFCSWFLVTFFTIDAYIGRLAMDDLVSMVPAISPWIQFCMVCSFGNPS